MSRLALGASTTFKLFVLAVLSLLLLIPQGLVHDLGQERAALAREAENRIAAGWGREQALLLPLLRFEYVRERVNKDNEVIRERRTRWLTPTQAQVDARLRIETRRIGLYALPIYTAKLHIDGRFQPGQVRVDLDEPETWTLEQRTLQFAPGDLTGLRAVERAELAGAALTLKPSAERWTLGHAYSAQAARAVLAAPLGIDAGGAEALPFAIAIELAGARALEFVPNAAEFTVAVQGDWPHPGFAGGALPRKREVREDGFSASWRLLDLSTGIPAVLADASVIAGWGEQAVGVSLVEPAGLYQQNERSAKYGVLVLALTIAALFLTEVLVGVRLHPFHYALVGLALAVFYLLLLALGEHIGFVAAYLLAAASVVAMVGGYSAAVLGGWGRGALGAGVLAALYGFLLVLIRAEELSLLLGAVGLALLLATAMYLTRRLDWYSAAPVGNALAPQP
ncbi:MAG: cell envelope integrity protein CreD [Xanthomonadales bacterium]|nr:Inner membrane protein CreD [Xanthomonadales bacterium]MCC6593145.1 cell envelope integrity protein CreD [Xanthomonadales bacterium]